MGRYDWSEPVDGWSRPGSRHKLSRFPCKTPQLEAFGRAQLEAFGRVWVDGISRNPINPGGSKVPPDDDALAGDALVRSASSSRGLASKAQNTKTQ
jgi:hypothetical protein